MVYKYKAVPVFTKGNFLFSDVIIIDTGAKVLHYIKRNMNVFSKTIKSVPFRSVAEVSLKHRNEWLLFSTIKVETSGGEIINASGFKPRDAKEIKHYLDLHL